MKMVRFGLSRCAGRLDRAWYLFDVRGDTRSPDAIMRDAFEQTTGLRTAALNPVISISTRKALVKVALGIPVR